MPFTQCMRHLVTLNGAMCCVEQYWIVYLLVIMDLGWYSLQGLCMPSGCCMNAASLAVIQCTIASVHTVFGLACGVAAMVCSCCVDRTL